MPDMLVKLYDLPDYAPACAVCAEANIIIRRAMAPDKHRVLEAVRRISGECAAGECDVCFAHTPVSCFVATRGKEILGYACYNSTAPDFFGPTALQADERGHGVGKALLLRSLAALHDEGYAYAIIGGVGPAEFYTKCVGATIIPDSTPGIYKDFIHTLAE
ncbi:MAG: GNAT family N-acetyltransferase [Oscillospiraceae bacterium]|jgi:GNAT superfamily N-acetyltransferase|nr:GNAT family N-acetyltransferase [Oscillospiraceae bacterium]